MKKKLASVVTCTLLAPMFLNGNVNAVYADSKENQISTAQESQEKAVDRKGLLGYYFKEKDFNNLTLFAPTRDNTLIYDRQTADKLLNKNQQTYQSIRWVGLIKNPEDGNFTFKLSDDEHAVIEIDGKVVSINGKRKQRVSLEKDKLVPIKIEYRPSNSLNAGNSDFQNLKLYRIDENNKKIPIEKNNFRNPDFQAKETQTFLTKSSSTSLFKDKAPYDENIDTDGDSIPDVWEENGYTIQKKVAVKWTEDLGKQGYTKYVSNPYEKHTVGDPYSDYEKAARDVDKSSAKETFNPLVAAFPIVNVSLENIILSPNKDLTNSVGSSSSNNWSYTNTEGASVEAGIGENGGSFGISANYQHSETVGIEWGTSKEDTSHINLAETAYLNANVRYNNVGTGSIYNAEPTISFILGGATITTVTAKRDIANSLSPGESYPVKGKSGLSINMTDDFGSRPIALNNDQVKSFLSNTPIMLDTDQVGGQYLVRDSDGKPTIGGDWATVMPQIKAKTASIIVDDGEKTSEKRVAARDYDNPEDKTPSLTLKDALKLSYPKEITEKEGLLYYGDKPIYEASVMKYVDKVTAEEVKNQINSTTEEFKDVKTIYDVKLTPNMNFTIKVATLYDGAEEITNGMESPIGVWLSTSISNGGNTGKKQFQLVNDTSSLFLDPKAREKLKKDNIYYLSMYMKADSYIEPIIQLYGTEGLIHGQKVGLTGKGYQRIDIAFPNSHNNSITRIEIMRNSTNNTNVYWDDVNITKIAAMKVEH
ncbi:binary toxin-like calcium binding domain-containing protein [Bacillus cereus]|uniref:binary toxin-like calcium binding domain-containing protein n=1 Tax=Bacillus cereus TaxID=1396 RepID=UPI0018F4ED07|nr:binary toxin-like calcium binding domain-containing protein [Bacillus cereus]MBJ8154289.1 hypothetical protein [Bacillus cereus]